MIPRIQFIDVNNFMVSENTTKILKHRLILIRCETSYLERIVSGAKFHGVDSGIPIVSKTADRKACSDTAKF